MRFHPDLENYRITSGTWASQPGKAFGAFKVPYKSAVLTVIADSGAHGPANGWEHVSVSLPNRTPNWAEMCHIKNLFWPESETVIQFHPKKSEYVNIHPHVLHLWKQVGVDHELPPRILV